MLCDSNSEQYFVAYSDDFFNFEFGLMTRKLFPKQSKTCPFFSLSDSKISISDANSLGSRSRRRGSDPVP
jgi:hypothetical protein